MKKPILFVMMISLCVMGCAEKQRQAETDPATYLSWYNLGLRDLDNPVCERDFKKAIKANPKFSPPYYWLASYYCEHEKIAQSIDYFEHYLRVADENDPQEKDRIKWAGYFIREMRLGNTDYDSITDKAMNKD